MILENAKFVKRMAFTLAEVLIVIGIIGIIAEMTIPTLMQNIETASNRTMFKKIYGQLNGVFITMINDNGGSFVGLSSDYDILRQYFSRYFKKLDECTWGNSRNKCWHDYSKIRDYSGNVVVDNSNPYADIYRADVQGFVIMDSILLQTFFDDTPNGLQCAVNFGTTPYCGWMRVDVNGFSKPNAVGKDIFYMLILKNKIVPVGLAGSGRYEAADTCKSGGTGEGCAAYVLQNVSY